MTAARTPYNVIDNEAAAANDVPKGGRPPRRLSELLAPALLRAERRCAGTERPIPLPWPVLADHFGGGLWPGLHILNKATGVGGTQLALQVALHAAKGNVPVLYFGLELGDFDLALRLLGEEAPAPWSALWTGKAGPEYVRRVRDAVPKLSPLPMHIEVARPMGLPPSELLASVEALRAAYPETDGPGSCPMLVIVDFLQLIGDEPDRSLELRMRIGQASYVLRDLANRFGCAVFCISSIAREKYKLANALHDVARLTFDIDAHGYPINRRILDPDAIVGAGKEPVGAGGDRRADRRGDGAQGRVRRVHRRRGALRLRCRGRSRRRARRRAIRRCRGARAPERRPLAPRRRRRTRSPRAPRPLGSSVRRRPNRKDGRRVTKKPIDLDAVRQARDALAKLAEDFPELVGEPGESNRAVWEEALEDILATKKTGAVSEEQIVVRLPKTLLDRVDAYADRLREEQAGPAWRRSDVVRLLLAKGLDGVEAKPRKK